MKEFEKWFDKKQSPEEIAELYMRLKSGELADVIAETAWRAALEWAISRIRDGSISYEQGHIEIEKEFNT